MIVGVSMNSIPGAFGKGEEMLGKNDFLRLLITQMRYQNPWEPLNNTEFTAQLAQFSSLEQLRNVNNNLRHLQRVQSSLSTAQALGFIGKKVKALGSFAELRDGNSEDLILELPSEAKEMIIRIYTSEGSLVRTINMGAQPAGRQTFHWDGKDAHGNKLADGIYTFSISATDFRGNPIEVSSFVRGTVTGIHLDENGMIYLLMGKRKVSLSQVVQVSE